jgi:L-seryl-tRNA(Ser) seleniumtransferase
MPKAPVYDPQLRSLPSVDRLAAALDAPHALAVSAARRTIDRRRRELSGDGAVEASDLVARAREELARLTAPSLRQVLNATGVIVHTNLGRAPLSAPARAAVARAAGGYTNLELDLDTGRRGSRQVHVAALLRELTGAEDALAVNNGAGAALLAVAALAGAGGEVIVSRGQLVEIGGGFRIPEVIEQAGARLVEVGTTNRTRLSDYERALAALEPARRVIVLRVHASNFRIVGFVESVEIEDLCRLGVPVVDDLGSGALADGIEALGDEPDVRRSVRAGVALACCSGDKLLGGPQAGLLVGRAAAVERAHAHPLARALRIGKLSLAALEATLALYRDPARVRAEVPVLAMLETGEDELLARARLIAAALGGRGELVRSSARVGGGALPLLELEGPAVAVAPGALTMQTLVARLRESEVAVIGRIHGGRLLLDPRTLTDEEARQAGALVARALDD